MSVKLLVSWPILDPQIFVPPELVKLLRVHVRRYGINPDGRIFQTAGTEPRTAYVLVSGVRLG